jgi:hypothetical protein
METRDILTTGILDASGDRTRPNTSGYFSRARCSTISISASVMD